MKPWDTLLEYHNYHKTLYDETIPRFALTDIAYPLRWLDYLFEWLYRVSPNARTTHARPGSSSQAQSVDLYCEGMQYYTGIPDSVLNNDVFQGHNFEAMYHVLTYIYLLQQKVEMQHLCAVPAPLEEHSVSKNLRKQLTFIEETRNVQDRLEPLGRFAEVTQWYLAQWSQVHTCLILARDLQAVHSSALLGGSINDACRYFANNSPSLAFTTFVTHNNTAMSTVSTRRFMKESLAGSLLRSPVLLDLVETEENFRKVTRAVEVHLKVLEMLYQSYALASSTFGISEFLNVLQCGQVFHNSTIDRRQVCAMLFSKGITMEDSWRQAIFVQSFVLVAVFWMDASYPVIRTHRIPKSIDTFMKEHQSHWQGHEKAPFYIVTHMRIPAVEQIIMDNLLWLQEIFTQFTWLGKVHPDDLLQHPDGTLCSIGYLARVEEDAANMEERFLSVFALQQLLKDRRIVPQILELGVVMQVVAQVLNQKATTSVESLQVDKRIKFLFIEYHFNNGRNWCSLNSFMLLVFYPCMRHLIPTSQWI